MTNDTPEITALREKFEEWAESTGRPIDLDQIDNSEYMDIATQLLWEGFQEGAKTTPREVPEAVSKILNRFRIGNAIARGDFETFFVWSLETHPQLKGLNDGQ